MIPNIKITHLKWVNVLLFHFNYLIIKNNNVFFNETVTESLIKDIPIITGVQHHRDYRPGDIVNLTCISRAKPAPKLSFMVNDEEVR